MSYYDSNYGSYTPDDVNRPDMDRRSNWDETDTDAESYLRGKPDIPDAQVQVDWDQSDDTEVDYIKNKPSIPDIPDAPAAGEADATYVLKVATDGTASWVAAE